MNRLRKGAVLLLCALLVKALLPTAAMAADIEIQSGAGTNTVNTTVVGFGGKEWYVIGDGTSGVNPLSGHLTLLAKSSFGTGAFRVGNNTQDDLSWTQYPNNTWYYAGNFTLPNDYNDSTLMNAMATATNALPTKEAALITARSLDNIGGYSVTNQSLWPLSSAEYTTMGSLSGDTFSGNFWLRSPGGGDLAGVGVPGGVCYDEFVHDPSNAVRPALNLNLSSVLFTSAAAGGKSKPTVVGASLSSAEPTTGAVKFTVENSSLTLTCTDTAARTAKPGDTVTMSYSGATTVTNNYVSCVIVNSSGDVLYYGKLADTAIGTASFTVPAMADGNYTIKLFSEEANGDNLTDFASAPVDIQLTVSNPAPYIPPYSGGWYPPVTTVPPVAEVPALAFPTEATAIKRINVYEPQTLKGKVQFRIAKGDDFTILGVSENGKAFLIEYDGQQGYVAIKDILATFGNSVKGAALRKASAYVMQDNGKLKRTGFFSKGQTLNIHGIDGGYFLNKQKDTTYWLKVSDWRLANK